MKLGRLIKICLSETYNAVQVGRYLSDTIPIKRGPETRRCFVTIPFQLYFRVCH
jgi:hypothetical protein